MKKMIKKPYIGFIGESAADVTGSCYLIKHQDDVIMLDCGMFQSNSLVGDYRVNHTKLSGVRPKEITAIILSHPHQDHCGRIPELYKNGCTATLYVPYGSKDILKVMGEDSVKIMQSDADKLRNKNGMNASALYSNEDVETMLQYIVEVDYGDEIKISDSAEFKYYNAGHTLYSSQILLTLWDNNKKTIIGYTGDIGSTNLRHPYIDNIEPLPYCDILIGEATYSAKTRNHKPKDRITDIAKIKSVVQECVDSQTRLLIPVFAFDRLETMLTMLYEAFDGKSPLPIIVDTPLGKKIAKCWSPTVDKELWDKVYHWNDVRWIDDFNESKLAQDIGLPYIILASSGMLTAGRALSWLKSMLPNPNDKIMFCGYSGEGTISDDIKKGQKKYIVIDGESYKNKAKIITLNSFSSHMCHNELLDYYTKLNYGRIYLVHSNQDTKVTFAQELKELLAQDGRTSRVIVANKETKVYLK